MKLIQFAAIFCLSIFIFSCGGEDKCEACELENQQDTISEAPKDLHSTLKDTVTEKKAVVQEMKENHKKIVEKYGEQWDFCMCVIKNDSINDAFEKGGMTSKQEDKLMDRWAYVDSKCKELLTTPNTTPEERAKHDKKVLKCLKENGLKK